MIRSGLIRRTCEKIIDKRRGNSKTGDEEWWWWWCVKKLEMKMMMMMMMMWEEIRERETERRRKRERERKKRETHTLVFLRKRLLRSQSVACAKVQAFKALQFGTQKKLAQRLDSLVRVSRRVERDQKKFMYVETLALWENAVTQDYRLNASVCWVRPCQLPSEYHLNLIAASFSGKSVCVLRPTGTVRPMLRSRSRSLHGKVTQLMWLPTWAWCCQDREPQIDWNDRWDRCGGKKQTQQHNTKAGKREGRGRTSDQHHVHEKEQNAV